MDDSNNDNSNNDNSNNTGLNSEISSIYDYLNSILMNPSVIIILVIVVVLYLIIFMSLGSNKKNDSDSNNNSNDNKSNSGTNIVSTIIIGLFIILVLINGFQYFFGIDIIASVKNLFSGQPEIDITVTNPSLSTPSVVPEIKLKKQVFNIPGNNYVYPDAKALCTAYGAELANYQQIEKSYNEGAEWCNYGWSEGQMALFPTQQSTFNGLQNIPGHENDCGRPGINGGFMANPALKFGVNCYGYKPRMTEEEEDLMQEIPIYPKTLKDIAMEKRVDYWKEHIPDILVSPFNHNNWSKI